MILLFSQHYCHQTSQAAAKVPSLGRHRTVRYTPHRHCNAPTDVYHFAHDSSAIGVAVPYHDLAFFTALLPSDVAGRRKSPVTWTSPHGALHTAPTLQRAHRRVSFRP